VTGEETFDAWGPADSRWSQWVKPVLFAHVDRVLAEEEREGPPPSAPAGWDEGWSLEATALLIELPGPQAAATGVAAVDLGFRPVPLFNALPGPVNESAPFFFGGYTGPVPRAAVEVRPTVLALAALGPRLRGGGRRGAGLPPDAPPAFLVDSRRLDSRGVLHPGRFDNRSAHGPSDFPSAERLREGGIARVVVLLETVHVGWDLLPVLEGWRRAGLSIAFKRTGHPLRPWPGRAGAWLWRVGAWLRRLTLAGSGRHGFGAWVTPAGG
jgi:hypothetical protein